jgi:hypothetical protein
LIGLDPRLNGAAGLLSYARGAALSLLLTAMRDESRYRQY